MACLQSRRRILPILRVFRFRLAGRRMLLAALVAWVLGVRPAIAAEAEGPHQQSAEAAASAELLTGGGFEARIAGWRQPGRKHLASTGRTNANTSRGDRNARGSRRQHGPTHLPSADWFRAAERYCSRISTSPPDGSMKDASGCGPPGQCG